MKLNVQLLPKNRHELHSSPPDLVAGAIWNQNRFLSGQEMAGLFAETSTVSDATRLCSGLIGRFCWVRVLPDTVWLAVDHLQSLPLYYALDGDNVLVGTIPGKIADAMDNKQIDPLLAAEYLVLGYVTGKETLMENIREVEPGTLVEIRRSHDHDALHAKIHQYKEYVHTYQNASRDQLTHDLDDIVLQTMKRTVEYADGRPIILPLSGGYDSRLIALSLSRLHCTDVHCISYGTKNSAEMKLSHQIAEKLGFSWTGVTYTSDNWQRWFHSNKRRDYYRQASREARIPNIQEFVAFGELTGHGNIPSEGVVLGGHVGGVLVGDKGVYDNYTYRENPETRAETILQHIFHYHYYLWDWSEYNEQIGPWFRDRILNSIGDLRRYPDSPSACEMWNLRQRQPRFIVAATRVYEFFGLDYLLPFCDQDYMRFWQTVPLAFRHDKGLYTDYIERLAPFSTKTHQPEKPVLKLRATIRNTPIFRPAQSLYQKWNKRWKLKNEYSRHPLAWYGIMEPKVFHSLFTGRENINSFQSLELLRTLMENGYLMPDMILSQAATILSGKQSMSL